MSVPLPVRVPVPMAAAPEYEVGELHSRAFCVGALGRAWRQQLGSPDLSLAAEEEEENEEEEEEDMAVAEELGCGLETAAELRAVCRWPRERGACGGGWVPPPLFSSGINSGEGKRVCIEQCCAVLFLTVRACLCVCVCA